MRMSEMTFKSAKITAPQHSPHIYSLIDRALFAHSFTLFFFFARIVLFCKTKKKHLICCDLDGIPQIVFVCTSLNLLSNDAFF